MSINLLKKKVGEQANEGLADLVTKIAVNTFKGWIPGHVSGIEKECQGLGLAMKRDLFSGEFLCVGAPGAFAAPESPQLKEVANISAPVTQIYNTPTTNITINNPVTYLIPPLPERRLSPQPSAPPPPPPVGTIPIPTLSEKSTFVQVALKDGKLGCLLHEPLSATPVIIEVHDRANFLETSEENQGIEGKKFLNWLLEKRGKDKIDITGNPAEDTATSLTQTGLFLIIKRPDLNSESEIQPLFGTETFQTLIGDYLARNRVQINPVTCLVPMDFAVVPKPPSEITVTEVLPNIVLGEIATTAAPVPGAPGTLPLPGSADALLQKIATCLGVDEYPASLPPSLISKDQGWLGNLIPEANIEIPNLTRLLSQFIKYFDEILGQWEIPIEVKDSDPTTPGDQPIGFKIPNLAEGFAEMFGLLLQSSSNLELLVNMQTRTLIEVGQDKQQNFISYKLLQALVDYINFDYKEVGTELPMMFKPGEDEVDKMLVECMTKVTVAEFDDKIDFQRHLLVLLEMAKMWKAQNFKKLDLGTGMKQQILDRIKALGQQSEELSVEKKDADGKDQFDRFCEDVETQFAATPGILDAAHPYGGDFEDRPRIKKLGQ